MSGGGSRRLGIGSPATSVSAVSVSSVNASSVNASSVNRDRAARTFLEEGLWVGETGDAEEVVVGGTDDTAVALNGRNHLFAGVLHFNVHLCFEHVHAFVCQVDAVVVVARVDGVLVRATECAQVDRLRIIDGVRVDQELQLVQRERRVLAPVPDAGHICSDVRERRPYLTSL